MIRKNNSDPVHLKEYQLEKQQLSLQFPQAYRTRGNRKFVRKPGIKRAGTAMVFLIQTSYFLQQKTQMGIVKILAAALLAAFLLLDPMTEAAPDPPQRPLCMPQYSLVNQACDSVILGAPLPNHSLTSGDNEGHGHGRRHGRRHRHRQGNRGSHHGSSSPEDNCCKWMKELDDECVCDLLCRLPPLLSKPAHEYTVYVGASCNVTYSCDMQL